jgi:hypothetical protein
MTRTITAAALCVGLLAMPLSAGFAQTMSTPVDRVLRPGDTIQWVPAPAQCRAADSIVHRHAVVSPPTPEAPARDRVIVSRSVIT